MIFSPAKPQQIIYDHLLEQKDALLFVGMGIGKTAACFMALNELFRSAEAFAALVIAPMRVCNLTWPMEGKEWDQFKWMRIANLREEKGQRDFMNGRAHIYVINWESIPLLVQLIKDRKGVLPYDIAIYDELTKAKNPSSKRVNLYRSRKVPRAARNWGLTGTPMPNTWMDIFAQVRLVDDGERLGNNFLEFKRKYFFAPATPCKPWQQKNGTEEELQDRISDITVTLKSSDWLQLPDIAFEDVEIKFTPELQKRYKLLEEELIIELHKEKTLNVANAAALVTKLMQFTSGYIYDEDKKAHHVHDLKFNELKKIAKHEKQPLLVATIYKHEQDRLRSAFPEAHFFSDAKTLKAQEQLIKDWNNGKIRMLVAHPASVGHGLNLQHGSSILVWYSLTYSRELYEQMIARLARRGQQNVIKIYRLMVQGTVDEAVAEALQSKAETEARLIKALQMLEGFRNKNSKLKITEPKDKQYSLEDF